MINKRSNRLRAYALCAILALGLGCGQVWGNAEKAEETQKNSLVVDSKFDRIVQGVAIAIGTIIIEKTIEHAWSSTKAYYTYVTMPAVITHLKQAQSLAQIYSNATSHEEAYSLEKPFFDVFCKIRPQDIDFRRGDITKLQNIKNTICSSEYKNETFALAVRNRYLDLINPNRNNTQTFAAAHAQQDEPKISEVKNPTLTLKTAGTPRPC